MRIKVVDKPYWSRRIAETRKLINKGKTIKERNDLAITHFCDLCNEFGTEVNWDGNINNITADQLSVVLAMLNARQYYTHAYLLQQLER